VFNSKVRGPVFTSLITHIQSQFNCSGNGKSAESVKLLCQMLLLDTFTMKLSDEGEVYHGERKTLLRHWFENFVENGAFAHYKQTLHFPQFF